MSANNTKVKKAVIPVAGFGYAYAPGYQSDS